MIEMAVSALEMSRFLQPFIGKGDFSIWVNILERVRKHIKMGEINNISKF